MNLTRRQFSTGLAAGLAMLPLLSRKTAAATVRQPKRLVFVTSVGCAYSDWLPTSAPGAPVTLGAASSGLAPVLGDIMLLGGLPMPFTGENHGTFQHTMGLDFGHNYLGQSVETYIAQILKPPTPQNTMLLGACAKNGSTFKSQGTVLQTIDSPLDAFQLAFAGNQPLTASSPTTALPRAQIAALVQRRIQALSSRVGATEQKKLALYSEGLTRITPSAAGSSSAGGSTGASSGGTPSASCSAPTAPQLNGLSPSNQGNTAAMGLMHMQLIPLLLSCDVTRVVGMQWGTSSLQTITSSLDTSDEHSNWHSGTDREPYRLAQENVLCSAFASMVSSLKNTADPLVAGTSMLDNTLVVWLRDIGNAPDHSQMLNPVVLAGATGYLKYSGGSGGTYYNLAGQGSILNVLLTMIEAMGVPYGTFGSTSGSAQSGMALSSIKL